MCAIGSKSQRGSNLVICGTGERNLWFIQTFEVFINFVFLSDQVLKSLERDRFVNGSDAVGVIAPSKAVVKSRSLTDHGLGKAAAGAGAGWPNAWEDVVVEEGEDWEWVEIVVFLEEALAESHLDDMASHGTAEFDGGCVDS